MHAEPCAWRAGPDLPWRTAPHRHNPFQTIPAP